MAFYTQNSNNISVFINKFSFKLFPVWDCRCCEMDDGRLWKSFARNFLSRVSLTFNTPFIILITSAGGERTIPKGRERACGRSEEIFHTSLMEEHAMWIQQPFQSSAYTHIHTHTRARAHKRKLEEKPHPVQREGGSTREIVD